MMFRLVLDVILYRGFVRTAHAEGSITHLPGECDSVFVDPSRRVGLQNLNCFGWGDADRKCNQQMRMISNATCREHRNPMISSNSREVFPEPGQHFVWNEVFNILIHCVFSTKGRMSQLKRCIFQPRSGRIRDNAAIEDGSHLRGSGTI